MFRRLRNKIILQNMLITSVIVIIAFVSIFAFVSISAKQKRPLPPKEFTESQEIRNIFMKEIERERDEQVLSLGLTLLIVGISVEIVVFVASYYFAEKSIQPVREAYKKQHDFIANASHELKTPIAAIQANFEALGAEEEPWKSNIETELARAEHLVGDMLTLARTDGRTSQAEKKDVNAAKIVRSRMQLIEARLGEKKLTANVPEKLIIKMNSADFSQVLDILLDNAVKYSKSIINVTLTEQKLIVENDGKTISKENLERVFDRFYQTDKTAEGSGLGLAIAKAVSERNDWKIVAESEDKITRFSVSF